MGTSEQHTKTSLAIPEEVFALENLGASMLYLGIIIHASVTYGVIDYTPAWMLKDHATHPLFDWLVSFIHCFRMPLFFVVSAYLGSFFYQGKGQTAAFRNQFSTLFIPFVFGVLFVLPLDALASDFSHAAMEKKSFTIQSVIDVLVNYRWFSSKIVHLWFLYFLLICHVLYRLLKGCFKNLNHFNNLFFSAAIHVFRSFGLRILVFAGTLFLCLCWMGKPFILTNNRWSINPAILACYFLFFTTGMLLHKTNSLMHLKRHSIPQLCAAILLFLFDKLFPWPDASWVLTVHQGLSALYTSLFIFGSIALFLTYLHGFRRRNGYFMTASTWVYVVHLPVVVWIPGFITGMALPLMIKFFVTVLFTLCICFLSYLFLVRNTFIEKFFAGYRYDFDVTSMKKKQDKTSD